MLSFYLLFLFPMFSNHDVIGLRHVRRSRLALFPFPRSSPLHYFYLHLLLVYR